MNFKKFSSETLSIFVVFYALIFTFITQAPMSVFLAPISGIGVEQWVNLTNQMFYGHEDFLFSYGPLKWLTLQGSVTPYGVSNYFMVMFFIAFYFAFFWTLLFKLILNENALFLLLIAFIFVLQTLAFEQIFFLLPIIMLFFIEFYCHDRNKIINNLLVICLGALSVFLLFIRFPYGLIAILVFGGYLFSLIFYGLSYKRLLLYLLSLGFFYVLLGSFIFHNINSLYYYLTINYQLSFANSIDMPEDIKVHSVCWIFVLMIFVIQNYALWRKKVLLLSINLLFYILFKLGFSRIDHMTTYFILPMSIVLLAIIFAKKKYGKWLYMFTLIILLALAQTSPCRLSPLRFMPIVASHKQYKEHYNDRMANLYSSFKLDESILKKMGTDPVDVYPYANQIIFANDLNYHYRPSFQNYMTLTLKLDQLNQAYFSGQDHPDFILWTAAVGYENPYQSLSSVFTDLDNRYVFNEDPLTTSAILLNYHLIDKTVVNKILVLVLQHNKANYVPLVMTPITTQNMKFNEWINVPQNYQNQGVLKLIPNFKFTWYGEFKNKLFFGDILNISYKLKNGKIYQYRLNILNAQSGIWVTPYIDNFSFAPNEVAQIMITHKGVFYFYDSFQGTWVATNISIKSFIR
jgi:hypothetical protein